MFYCKFNAKTYPKFVYNEYLRSSIKKEVFENTSKMGYARWNRIENATSAKRVVRKNQIFPSTYSIGIRNKKRVWYDGSLVITSRALDMSKYCAELRSARWVDEITDATQERQIVLIYIGNLFVRHNRVDKHIYI